MRLLWRMPPPTLCEMGDSTPIYQEIGRTYRSTRTADPRIASLILRAVGAARRIVDVGAGSGSYEPQDRDVVAVEPSEVMIRQRSPGSGPVVRGVAEHLPFGDRTFDAAMAVLTVHHWTDPRRGLWELRRVAAGPVVVFTFDQEVHERQWLIGEYLPAMASLDANQPSPAQIAEALGGGEVQVVPIAHDCEDGFCHAWWRRPEAYLDPVVRQGISGIARLPKAYVADAMGCLAEDLRTGAWAERHSDLLGRDSIDAGYRLVVAR